MRLKSFSISRRWLLLAVVAVAASIVEAQALRGQNVPAAPISAPCTEVVRVPAAESRFAPNVLSLSPAAARVALSVRTGTDDDLKDVLKVYDTGTKQWVEPAVRVPAGEELQSLIFSPDGQWQLAHSLGPRLQRALRVYRASDLRECFEVKSDGYGLSPTAFSADGKLLVRPEPREGDKPFCFVVVNVETGAVRSTLHIELKLLSFGMFHRIAFTADGKWVYSNQDDRVLVWDVATGQQHRELRDCRLPAESGAQPARSPSGRSQRASYGAV
jgi:WD40 repeat protein